VPITGCVTITGQPPYKFTFSPIPVMGQHFTLGAGPAQIMGQHVLPRLYGCRRLWTRKLCYHKDDRAMRAILGDRELLRSVRSIGSKDQDEAR